MRKLLSFYSILLLLGGFGLVTIACNDSKAGTKKPTKTKTKKAVAKTAVSSELDTVDYNKRMAAMYQADSIPAWQLKTPYPLKGALLPYNRIIAFYGNLYSKRMGILGELPKDDMLKKLQEEVAAWKAADSTVNTLPALHYIAVSAQSKPGKANQYRLRMPFKQIDTIISWAKSIDALVFLDVQIGQGTIKEEVSQLIPYLKLPNVHLGIDPEFAMKDGHIPGTKIGTLSATEINDAIDILTQVVKENHLTPKVLIVHRFTKPMVTDYKRIKTCPEVQIVMNMDGFGSKPLKRATYKNAIFSEPVQFTGFKLFYKNDNAGNATMYTPEELMHYKPIPIYIQYQ
jgi:hypothetical protein